MQALEMQIDKEEKQASLNLLKTVSSQLENYFQNDPHNESIVREIVMETYMMFGADEIDREELIEIVQEEQDKVDYYSKELQFTEH